LTGDIGSIKLAKLLEVFTKPENIFKASCEKLIQIYGIGEKAAYKISSFSKNDLDKELASAKKQNIEIITQEEADYPKNLKYIPDPPIVLYVKGKLKEEDVLSIAIVGSRRGSFYGLSCAKQFAAQLAGRGFTIVSGLARGIDTSAHRGALSQHGRTIAVIGSGFNNLYPPENKELAEEIVWSGAVVSEFPMDAQPLPQNFPRRNRVISGLSLGVLVAEAARNSGALITADFALEQGREVFALPGKVDASNSFGTNGLIKQGAKLVSCVEEIIEEFDFLNASACPAQSASSPVRDPAPDLIAGRDNLRESALKDDLDLTKFISEEPVTIDEIAEKSCLSIPQLSVLLLRLKMQKLIRELPGKLFVRN